MDSGSRQAAGEQAVASLLVGVACVRMAFRPESTAPLRLTKLTAQSTLIVDSLLSLFSQHGLLAVLLVVLLEQLGLPLPSLPFLLLAGAQAAQGGPVAWQSVAVAALGATVANSLWFLAGRRLGRRVLTTLCRISISPDTCVRQNELSFARRGAATLVIAKFVPGLSILAPPLAGALGMRTQSFLLFNLAGAVLWATTGVGAGLVVHQQIGQLVQLLGRLGHVALMLAGAALGLYVLWRLWRRWRLRRALMQFERVLPAQLAEMLAQGLEVLIVDVRAASVDGPQPARIPGARHLDLGRMNAEAIVDWPAGPEVFTYCACPNDASALRAAHWLSQQGRKVRVLSGGIDAWMTAGYALEAGRA